jgi:hypothetical protein
MTFEKGNTDAVKLKDDSLKKQAFEQYCAHLAKGKSKKSWCFEHPELTLTWETMEKYIKTNDPVFDPIKKSVAEIKGYAYWEEVAEKSAEGKNQANTASLQMVMRNKFGWDKESHVNHTYEPEARRLLKKLEEE